MYTLDSMNSNILQALFFGTYIDERYCDFPECKFCFPWYV